MPLTGVIGMVRVPAPPSRPCFRELSVAKSAKSAKPVDFEKAMAELQTLVEKMEQGEFTLEESIRQFERGIELTRQCSEALKKAEQKVQQLTSTTDGEELREFELPDEEA